MIKNRILHLLQDPKLYRYIIVGGIAAIVDLSFFLLLRQYLDYHYLIIATFSFLLATFVNYLLCNRYVFQYRQHHSVKNQILLIYLVGSIGLFIHHSCLALSMEWFLLPIFISKIFAMGIAFLWNFLSRKHIVFKAIQQ